MKKKESSS